MRLPLIALFLLALPGGALAQRPAQAPPVRGALQAPPVRVVVTDPPGGLGPVEYLRCPVCDGKRIDPRTGKTCERCGGLGYVFGPSQAAKPKTDPAGHKPLKKVPAKKTRIVQVCGPDGQCREVPAEVWKTAKKSKRSNRGPATYNALLPLVQPPAMMAPTGHATYFMGRPAGGGG